MTKRRHFPQCALKGASRSFLWTLPLSTSHCSWDWNGSMWLCLTARKHWPFFKISNLGALTKNVAYVFIKTFAMNCNDSNTFFNGNCLWNPVPISHYSQNGPSNPNVSWKSNCSVTEKSVCEWKWYRTQGSSSFKRFLPALSLGREIGWW